MHGFFLLAVVLIVVRLAATLWLSALNRAEVRRNRAAPPEAVIAVLGQETYLRSVAYALAKSRFAISMPLSWWRCWPVACCLGSTNGSMPGELPPPRGRAPRLFFW